MPVRRLAPLLTAFIAILLLPAAAQASARQSTLFEAPRELMSDDAGLRAQTLDEIKALGAEWVRVVLYWRDVAPDPNTREVPAFNERDPGAYPGFGKYDRVLAEMRARGLNPLVTVTAPAPRWATRFRQDFVTRPEPARFARFFEAVVRRYGDVRHFGVWNEPNHPDFLQPQYAGQGKRRESVSGKLYRRLFQAASDGRRNAGRPGVRLLFGETSPRGNTNVSYPLRFFRDALCMSRSWNKRSSCGELDADAYAHHPYTTKSGPWFVPPNRDDVTIGSLSRLNRALARAGQENALRRGMGIWMTEFGIQSVPDTVQGVSETAQAEYRAVGERMAWRNPRVRMFSQYLMRDSEPGPRNSRGNLTFPGFESGLRQAGGDQKRAYDGFRTPLVARRLSNGKTSLWGLVRPGDGAQLVAIDVRSSKGGWRSLKRDRTDARGYWTTTTRTVRGGNYRVRWTDPQGTQRTGPPTRAYAR